VRQPRARLLVEAHHERPRMHEARCALPFSEVDGHILRHTEAAQTASLIDRDIDGEVAIASLAPAVPRNHEDGLVAMRFVSKKRRKPSLVLPRVERSLRAQIAACTREPARTARERRLAPPHAAPRSRDPPACRCEQRSAHAGAEYRGERSGWGGTGPVTIDFVAPGEWPRRNKHSRRGRLVETYDTQAPLR
jgi:hypothetical protein